MKIFGKDFSAYINFQKMILLLILVVGFLRLALSLGGLPVSTVKWFSITSAMFVGMVYYSVRVYTTGFGSYRHLFPLLLIQGLIGQLITIIGIEIANFTGTDNIFSIAEYSHAVPGKSWMHAASHLVLGGIILPLMWWLAGCLMMFVTSKLNSSTNPKSKVATA